MGFVNPDPTSLTYDPYLSAVRMSDANPFITIGTSGIFTIRMQTSGGYVYDMSVDNTGAWVATLVSSPGSNVGQSIGLLLALTYS